MKQAHSLNVGDWVRSYSAGIWQIYRLLTFKCLDPDTAKEQIKTTVFSKRFVSSSYKRSFTNETCAPSFVKLLDSEERNQLDSFISQNAILYEKFCEYEPRKLDCIYSAKIGIPDNRDPSMITKELSNVASISDLDIDHYLATLSYDTKAIPYWTIQFVCEDFQTINGYLMFKFSRVLE